MKIKNHLFIIFAIILMACSFPYDPVVDNDHEPNLIMENVEYVRMANGNPEIRIIAQEVRQYEAKHTMELDDFTFEQFNAAPAGLERIPEINARGKAKAAHLETDTGNAFLRGEINIEVVSEDMTLETEEFSWQNEERIINAPGTVNITRSDGTTLTGTGFSADVRTRSWEIESGVEGSIVEESEDQ